MNDDHLGPKLPIEGMPRALRSVYEHLAASLTACDLGPGSRRADFAHLNPDIDDVGNVTKDDEDYRLANSSLLGEVCNRAQASVAKWLAGYPVFDIAYGNVSRYFTVRVRFKPGGAGGYLVDAQLRHGATNR